MADDENRSQAGEGGEARRPGLLQRLLRRGSARRAATEEVAARPGGESAAEGIVAWLRMFLFGLLAVVAGALVTYSGYYLITRKPIVELPLARAVARGAPPRYLFSIYGVSRPLGVAVTPTGQRIYVAESSGERRLRAFDADGKLLGSYSAADTTPGNRNPTYVAVDAAGIIYVSDRLGGVIDTFGADGTYLGVFEPGTFHGPEGGRRWLPLGISFDRESNFYVTDVAEEHQIYIFAKDGTLVRSFGRNGLKPGELNWPQGVVADSRGRLFVSNGNNGRIDIFDKDGKPLGAFGRGTGVGTVGMPRGIAVDSEGRLYVADIASHQVNVYDVSSDEVGFLFSFGGNGIGDGEFSSPFGVAVDSANRIYVTDRDNNRVQVWVY